MDIYKALDEYGLPSRTLKKLDKKIYKLIKNYYCIETYCFSQYPIKALNTWFDYTDVDCIDEGWIWTQYKQYKTHNKLVKKLHKKTKETICDTTYYCIDGNSIILYTYLGDYRPKVYVSIYDKKLPKK